MSSSTKYGLDPEYKYKVVQSTSTASPSGLTRTTAQDKSYQDTDANDLPDLITETVTTNGSKQKGTYFFCKKICPLLRVPFE